MNAECKMMKAEYRVQRSRQNVKCRMQNASGIHHSSFCIHHFRAGISLLEILVSIGILSVGLLGVASLIPIGKLAMIDVNRSDRTGACGRAAIHELKIRRMLDPTGQVDPSGNGRNGWNGPFVIDPLGVINNLYDTTTNFARMNLGGTRPLTLDPPTTFSPYFPLPRFTLNWSWVTPAFGERVFRWSDELTFDLPKDATKRPRPVARDINGLVGPYPPWPGDASPLGQLDTFANEGKFSWFITANPLGNNTYSVSVVVCEQRVFTTTTPGVSATNLPTSERTVDVVDMTGGTIRLEQNTTDVTGTVSTPLNSTTFPLKKDQWVMLVGWEPLNPGAGNNSRCPRECKWYRVVGIGTDVPNMPYLSLDGPNWDWQRFHSVTAPANYCGTTLVVVDGVSGVYTTTVQLD